MDFEVDQSFFFFVCLSVHKILLSNFTVILGKGVSGGRNSLIDFEADSNHNADLFFSIIYLLTKYL